MPLIGGLFLVGCGNAAANDTCAQLQEYEQRIIEADPEDENTSNVLAATYDDVGALADEADGEVGDALQTLQPLLNKLEALTGNDEEAALQAKEELAELSEDEIQDIDDAADYINETCELTVLL
ncbi:MAG TPA: hypothetical protein VIG67_04880 [Yaniella sp.]